MPSIPMNNFSLNREFNPNAQFTIGNFAAFADAASSSPTDGTGGAPTVTIARSLATPLEGVATLLFTKDAANRQGEGFSADVNLSPADQTKVFTLSYDYQITTGTYTGYQVSPSYSDLTMWVYDITNAVMYQVAGYQIDGSVSTTNQYAFQGSWQVPVGCLQARIIWYLGNTGASAFTAKFNNISFGREPRVQGAIETPWLAFTPTGSLTTNVTYTGFKRRVGDTAEYQVKVAFSGANTEGIVAVDQPAGETIDTTKLTQTTNDYVFGDSSISGLVGGQDYLGSLLYFSATRSRCRIWIDDSGTGSAYVVTSVFSTSANIPTTYASGDFLIVKWKVPIVGWTANGTLGQDADTRVMSCKYVVGVTNSYANRTNAINYGTKIYDDFGGVTTGAGFWRMTVPVAGTWHVNATAVDDWGPSSLILFKNGGAEQYLSGAGATELLQSGSADIYLKAGEYVDVRLNATATHLIACEGLTLGDLSVFSAHRVSGPAQIQASNIPKAAYNTNAGQAIANGAVVRVDFEDKIFDTFGSVITGASWSFYCSRAGYVRLNSMVTFASAAFSANSNLKLWCYKNGSAYQKLDELTIQAAVTDTLALNGSALVPGNAGDSIDVRVEHGESASRSLTATATDNYVDINYTDGM